MNKKQDAKTNSSLELLQKLVSFETPETIRMIKNGLDFTSFDTLQQCIGISRDSLAKMIYISRQTLNRRKKEGKFLVTESERIYCLASLFIDSLDLFELNLDSARIWFKSPNRALSNNSPLEYAETFLGAREVYNLIGRLKHSIVP